MTPLQRYIAEEIATDHVDGLLSRREALRRLALLGIGTAAATALIAACGQNQQPTGTSTSPSAASGTPTTAAAAPPGMDAALATTPAPAVSFRGPGPKHRNPAAESW